MQYVITADIWGLLLLLLILLVLVGVPLFLARRARQEAQGWREAIETMPVGALLFNKNKRQLFTNSQGKTLSDLINPAQIEQIIQTALRGGHGTTLISPPQGGNVQAIQAQSLALQGSHVLVTLRDISEQQQAANSYKKFIYSVSHELLTPLTAVRGHLSHLEQAHESGADSSLWQGSLNVARGEIERLTRLTSNLLLLSRLEGEQPAQRQPTNLATVAEEVALQMLEKADERHATLNIDAEPNLPRMPLDRDAWKQVFLNLIDNAIKYGKDGGVVDVKISKRASSVLISVSDNGPGIPPQDLPHIFDEMFRAENHREVTGNGLGLAIVRKIVEQHEGTIACKSTLGEGTRFEITLPVERDVTVR